MNELRQTARRLRRALGFSLATVGTLAIGIGATVAIFSVVNGVLLNPLPFPDSARLVSLSHRSPPQGLENLPASTAIYFTYRDYNRTFESVALWLPGSASVTLPGEPEQVRSMAVTFEFLPTLRVAPAVGRAFAAADDQPESAPTAMLSHAYWQRRFGGAQSALGQNLVVDGVAHEVIGVLPNDFRFSNRPADVLLPLRPDRASSFVGPLNEAGIARLRDGVTIEEANADAERMLPILKESFRAMPGIDLDVFRLEADVKLLKETFVRDLGDVLLVLLGTIGLLLAVACANVANLHLIRTEARSQELAIQAALGASRGRLASGILSESVLLAVAGGALGLILAALALPILLATAADELPAVLAVAIDRKVVAFAIAVSLLAGAVFGAAPALRYAGARVAGHLAGAGRGYSTSRDRHRVQRALIAAQAAFALILLVASGLMIRTFQSLQDVDPGFAAPEQVQTVSVALPQAVVPAFPRAVLMFERMQDAIGALSGVESVGFTSRVPLAAGGGPQAGFFVENSAAAEIVAPPPSALRYASPRFFETLGTPLVAGRTFEWVDHHEARSVAIVSESFARREWGSAQAALGKRVRMTLAEPWNEVIGVVGDVRHQSLDSGTTDAVYLTLGAPLAQFMARRATFVIRSERVNTAGFLEDLQRAVWSVEPSVPLWEVETLADLHARATAGTALTLILLAITGGMALLLGLIGIYGVLGYMLSQRTREIGIRSALGAGNTQLKRMLVAKVMGPVIVGIGLGLASAAALSRLIESFLFGVTPLDALVYGAAALLLVVTAVIAAYLPARRAARVDPLQALRSQ